MDGKQISQQYNDRLAHWLQKGVRLLPAVVLIATASCTAEEPMTQTGEVEVLTPEACIVALQGGASMCSRDGYESTYGESCADRADVYAYFDIGTGNKDIADLRLLTDTVNGWNRIPGRLDHSVNTPNGRNTYGNFPVKFTTNNGGVIRHRRFSFLTVAYNHNYAGTFRVNRASKRDDCTLELVEQGTNMFKVPELYYSNVGFPLSGVAGTNWAQHVDWGTLTDTGAAFFDKTYNVILFGYLPRIVSQFNVTLTELPYQDIDRIELVANRLPSKIRLWATTCHHHSEGGLYPINLEQVTQVSNCIERQVVVDCIDNPETPTVTLSTFMLPSSVGFSLTVMIYSNQYDLDKMESDGYDNVTDWPENLRTYKTYTMNITPRADTYITDYAGSYCLHYNDGNGNVANNNLEAGTPIKIYSATEQQFFSISNIRVHIEGQYGSATGTDVTIEVEPAYERKHDITI